MKEIVMFGGVKTQVDDEDYEAASKITWHADYYDSGIVYARCRHKFPGQAYKNITLHRFLMGFPKGKVIDHIDGDGLNNQRSNLRICSATENHRNMRKHCDGKNKYKGVHPDGKGFSAFITYNKNRLWLGKYSNEELAGAAYNAAAIEFFGDYTNLNTGLQMDMMPPDGAPTFSEWVKRNMPGFTLVNSKVPGGEEMNYGRNDEGGEGHRSQSRSEAEGAPEQRDQERTGQ